MMQTLNVTKLRKNLYKVVDTVIKSGVPQKIERKGYKLKLVLADEPDKLSRLKPHNTIVGDPDELINLKLGTWQEPKNV